MLYYKTSDVTPNFLLFCCILLEFINDIITFIYKD